MPPRLIFIGGTSHTGKSTLARVLGGRFGADVIATDSLGRHPGRPWGPVAERPHVVDYYLNLSAREQLADVLTHYRETIWPEVIKVLAEQQGLLILEGSALLPGLVADIEVEHESVWLIEPASSLIERIHHESGYRSLSQQGQSLVGAFVARTLAYQSWLEESLIRHGEKPGVPTSLA